MDKFSFVNLKDIKPSNYNPRVSSKKQMKFLKKQIQKYGLSANIYEPQLKRKEK